MFRSTPPAVSRYLFVRGNVGHVVHSALLALVHGFVGFLVASAEAEAPPETRWRSRRKHNREGEEEKQKLCVIRGSEFHHSPTTTAVH